MLANPASPLELKGGRWDGGWLWGAASLIQSVCTCPELRVKPVFLWAGRPRGESHKKKPPSAFCDGNTRSGGWSLLETALMSSAHLDLQVLSLKTNSVSLILIFYIVQLMHSFSKSSSLGSCRKEISFRGRPRWRWWLMCQLQFVSVTNWQLALTFPGPCGVWGSRRALRDCGDTRAPTPNGG